MRTKLDPYDVEEAKEYAHRELLNEKPGLRSEGDKKKGKDLEVLFSRASRRSILIEASRTFLTALKNEVR
jgi:hypothetical protein